MSELGRWNGMDQLSESYHSTSPYAYVLNNPINMIDPDGRVTMAAMTQSMWSETPDGSNSYWFNNGSGRFTSYDGGKAGGGGGLAYGSTVSYNGIFTMGDGIYTMPPLVLNGHGTASTWGSALSTYTINHNAIYNGIAGVQAAWNNANRPFDPMSWVKNDGGIMMMGGAGDPLGIWEGVGIALSNSGDPNMNLAALPLLVMTRNGDDALKLLAAEKGLLIQDSQKKGLVKAEYLFENLNDAKNFGSSVLGPSKARMYDETGKWIGWENKAGNQVYWKHGDWGKGKGSSTFPHINYIVEGQKGHFYLKNKIK